MDSTTISRLVADNFVLCRYIRGDYAFGSHFFRIRKGPEVEKMTSGNGIWEHSTASQSQRAFPLPKLQMATRMLMSTFDGIGAAWAEKLFEKWDTFIMLQTSLYWSPMLCASTFLAGLQLRWGYPGSCLFAVHLCQSMQESDLSNDATIASACSLATNPNALLFPYAL